MTGFARRLPYALPSLSPITFPVYVHYCSISVIFLFYHSPGKQRSQSQNNVYVDCTCHHIHHTVHSMHMHKWLRSACPAALQQSSCPTWLTMDQCAATTNVYIDLVIKRLCVVALSRWMCIGYHRLHIGMAKSMRVATCARCKLCRERKKNAQVSSWELNPGPQITSWKVLGLVPSCIPMDFSFSPKLTSTCSCLHRAFTSSYMCWRCKLK